MYIQYSSLIVHQAPLKHIQFWCTINDEYRMCSSVCIRTHTVCVDVCIHLYGVWIVMVRSLYHLTMLAVPHLIKTKGNIVNVSSVNGLRAVSNNTAPQTWWSRISRALIDSVSNGEPPFSKNSWLRLLSTDVFVTDNTFFTFTLHVLLFKCLYKNYTCSATTLVTCKQ